MQFDTLTLYIVAAAVSLSLALVLIGFKALRPRAVATPKISLALMMLAIGFFGAGFGPALPRWATVIGTNLMLISAGVIMHTAFVALTRPHPTGWDKFGWGVLAFAALPFLYWGLVEPNGHYRSVVFSMAVLSINGRTAIKLSKAARSDRSLALGFLAMLFVALSLWMLGRALLLLFSQVPEVQRGANPTTWVTVAWYVVLISLITVATLWLETTRLRDQHLHPEDINATGAWWTGVLGMGDNMHNKLILLWSIMLVVTLATFGELGVSYSRAHDLERKSLESELVKSNEAFTEHSNQVVSTVDALLTAVQLYFARTQSLEETERFIDSLNFNRTVIGDLYLIDAVGRIVITHNGNAAGISVVDREYFRYHQNSTSSEMFFSAVERGKVTNEYHFRISRRINLANGQFGGVVLATVDPQAFSVFYKQLDSSGKVLVSLLSTHDRKLRAGVPVPVPDQWQTQIDSPIWNALDKAPFGVFEIPSPADGADHLFAYKRVSASTLVMMSGASTSDLTFSVWARLRWIVVSAVVAVGFMLVMSMLLTLEIRYRNEQDRFLSMLGHELKTPLSVIQMTLSSLSVPTASMQRLLRATGDMASIVDRSLQADRIHRRRVNYTPSDCHIDTLVTELVESCPAPDRINVNLMPLPACTTDIQLLRVVIDNLIDNALKYAADRSTISVDLSTQTHIGKPGIQIVVSNEAGPAGFPQASQVFKKYYRAAGAKGKTGSGLGLYIAAGMAGILGGHLYYDNDGGMIRFKLWIPV